MDDFQLGLSSSTAGSFRDDFYESFQAPQYYDFNNPQDPEHVDEWFLKRTSIASLKEELSELIAQSKEGASTSAKKPAKTWAQRFYGLKPKDKLKQASQLDENEDPNQATRKWKREARTRPNETGETGSQQDEARKKDQLLVQAQSPVPVAKSFSRIPATVPQNKKVLCARKAALETKQDFRPRASKALFAEPTKRESTQDQAIDEEATVSAKCTDETATEQQNSGSGVPSSDLAALSSVSEVQHSGKNYSSEFEESCRQSGELPKCKRALMATNEEMIEQVELAVKSLTVHESKVACIQETEVSTQDEATLPCDVAKEKQQIKPPVFSFEAVRKDPNETRNGRKRKSAELYPTKGSNRCKKVAPASAVQLSMLVKFKKLKITCPQPFRLRTEERAALKGAETHRKVEEYPAPLGFSSIATTNQPKAAPVRKPCRSRKPQAIKPSTTNPVSLSIEMITKDLREMKQRNEDKQELKLQIRKGTNTHAMPSFDRPFKPQRSTKQLTIPVEPKFHSIHGRRTCVNHN